MWQNHKLSPWKFTALSKKRRAFLIASEMIEIENREKAKKEQKHHKGR